MPRLPRRRDALDLFGEVPVTWADVAAWARAVADIGPDSPRFAAYVTAWNVPDKVRAAKLDGSFARIVGSVDPVPAHEFAQFRPLLDDPRRRHDADHRGDHFLRHLGQ